MSKLIFFDIDGTLWDEKMIIPESTKEAIAKLKEKGHKTFICSGRPRANIMEESLHELGFDGIIAACGNHIEMNGEIIYERHLSKDIVKKIVDLLKECDLPIILEGPVCCWISDWGFDNDPYVNYLFESMADRARLLKEYTDDIKVNKFSAAVLKHTNYHRFREELSDDFDFYEHDERVMEAVPKNTSKATGIKWLCDYLGADISDTYAFGDSINDLDMLKSVGHGIAMGNGTEIAKNAAEHITTDIHDDGILNGCKYYGLI